MSMVKLYCHNYNQNNIKSHVKLTPIFVPPFPCWCLDDVRDIVCPVNVGGGGGWPLTARTVLPHVGTVVLLARRRGSRSVVGFVTDDSETQNGTKEYHIPFLCLKSKILHHQILFIEWMLYWKLKFENDQLKTHNVKTPDTHRKHIH